MKEVAGSFGDVEIVAVATSAVREARNRDEFLVPARDAHRCAGRGDQRLRGSSPDPPRRAPGAARCSIGDLLVVDIGGGSTEFCVGSGEHVDRGAEHEARRDPSDAAVLLRHRRPPTTTDRCDRKAVKECRQVRPLRARRRSRTSSAVISRRWPSAARARRRRWPRWRWLGAARSRGSSTAPRSRPRS